MKDKRFSDPADQPTRSTVYELFDDLIPTQYHRDDKAKEDPDYLAACDAVAQRELELTLDAKLLKLAAARDRILVKVTDRNRRNADKAKRVKREYNAKGLTPEVIKKIAKLVDEVNS